MDFHKLHGQHRAIVRLASDIIGLTSDLRTRDDAVEARLLIERLDQVLGLHLELEDREVMPALMASEDAETRAVATDCVEEMGGLGAAWRDHLALWSVEAIHREPQRFRCAMHSLMKAIVRRVEREESELYPLAEALSKLAA